MLQDPQLAEMLAIFGNPASQLQVFHSPLSPRIHALIVKRVRASQEDYVGAPGARALRLSREGFEVPEESEDDVSFFDIYDARTKVAAMMRALDMYRPPAGQAPIAVEDSQVPPGIPPPIEDSQVPATPVEDSQVPPTSGEDSQVPPTPVEDSQVPPTPPASAVRKQLEALEIKDSEDEDSEADRNEMKRAIENAKARLAELQRQSASISIKLSYLCIAI